MLPAAGDPIPGQPLSVSGTVVHGDKRGRELGFPTANIAAQVAGVAEGIYAGWVRIAGHRGRYGATISVGTNPTFSDVHEVRIEAYLHDFSGDLYGLQAEVELIARLRETVRFDSVGELIAQSKRDIAGARSILATP